MIVSFRQLATPEPNARRCAQLVVPSLLAAWVLVAPPIQVIGENNAAVNPASPLSSWIMIGNQPKDSQYECEQAKQRIVDQAQPPPGASDSLRAAINIQKLMMKCLSTDTPGLPGH